MKSTRRSIRTSPFVLVLSHVTLLGAGGLLWGCTAEFEAECPEGSEQTGGGDVNKACVPRGGSGGAAGQGDGGPSGGAGGSAGSSGSGGSGSGVTQGSGGSGGEGPVPVGQECAAETSKCTEAGQQTCSAEGTWGAVVACDIACDAQGGACVVPVQVGVGNAHACARLSDSTVRCWGNDDQGQLGQGVELSSTKPLAVAGLTDVERLYVGSSTNCAVRKDKSAFCWGDNSSEQITPDPSGTLSVIRTPTNLNVQGVGAASVSSHVCILKETGASASLQCKGYNSFGQLGNTSALDSAGFVSPKSMPSAPVEVSNGGIHTCAALQNGSVYCWGFNVALGLSNSSSNVLAPRLFANSGFRGVNSGGTVSCAISSDNSVSCWGANVYGQLGRGASVAIDETSIPGKVSGGNDAKQVAAGYNHVCILKNDGSVWCWGYNVDNQLGNVCAQASCDPGEDFSRSPTQVQQLAQVEQIASGLNTTCALKADKSIVCWGKNKEGQLGNGQLGGSSATPTRVVWK